MPKNLIKTTLSFWEKPEGTTGMIFGAGILGGIGWLAFKIMPFIATMLETTLKTAILAGTIGVLTWVFVLDPTLRNRLWLLYTLVMEKFTYALIKRDPFAFLRVLRIRAQKKLQEVDERRKKVKGSLVAIHRELDSFKKEQTEVQNNLNWMQRNGKPKEVVDDEASKLTSLAASITRMTNSCEVIDGFYAVTTKVYEELVRFDAKTAWEIDHQEREYVAISETNTVLDIMMAVIKGTDENSQLRDKALSYVNTDYSQKLGRIESTMEDMSKFLEKADMKNSQYAEQGRKLLDDLNKRDISVGTIQGATPTGDVLYKIK